jgi:hypothetical protein
MLYNRGWLEARGLDKNALAQELCERVAIVDCHRMVMSKTMVNSVGKKRVLQTQHGAAKSIRNFVHS